MLQKGLKSPADKLQLLKVLSLGEVLSSLEGRTRGEKMERKAQNQTDEGEESYREALGRLVCGLGQELVKLWEDVSSNKRSMYTLAQCDACLQNNADEDVRLGAGDLLEQVLPVMLRFLADEYDDTSSTMFPFLTSLFLAVCLTQTPLGLPLMLATSTNELKRITLKN